MAWRGQLSRNMKELRILLCQSSPASSATRFFISTNIFSYMFAILIFILLLITIENSKSFSLIYLRQYASNMSVVLNF
ncbi:NADH dehydrogenase [ubiquinone] 1 alpha subcomplex subunit 2 [Morella rubra]|uniref:NADH dehydrogenase [ubiquinone] 1 alpha subcomplex subunit 2 n=1 Tax=Morella rubra TaxID=262757 RepID=A0A6A1UIL0_9ROSI|nr:NADH dehydrogenase [ubiquinone] 1 alpha subcomplex subunit 2 [Morella rubra]